MTGGAGFIGSHLTDRLLQEGLEVHVVDDLSSGSLANLSLARELGGKRFTFCQIDVSRQEFEALVAKVRPEVIFHLAANSNVRKSMVDPVIDAETNIIGSLRVLEAAKKSGVAKVVYATSAGVYGAADTFPISEETPHAPDSNYGVSKDVVIRYLQLYRKHFDVDYTALILANVYGPRQGASGEGGVVSIFASQLLASKPLTIIGNGNQTRDFVFVEDVVNAMERSMDLAGGMSLNIGSGTEITVNELALLMREQACRKWGRCEVPITYLPAVPGEIDRSCLDIKRAAWYLRWHPRTDLESGIIAVLEDLFANS